MADPNHEIPEPPQAPGFERRTRAPGDRSRARVLEHAAALATLEGLDGVSIAGIASATGMPKSSVYVLFGSKEEPQLATIDAARANFIRHVVTPAITATPPGRQRLQRLRRPPRLRRTADLPRRLLLCHRIRRNGRPAWTGTRPRRPLSAAVAPAPHRDDPPGAHRSRAPPLHRPDQLAFELGAILAGSSIAAVLHNDNTIIDRARQAVRARLDRQDGATMS
jgi:AcrR family transcriptional regulator